MRDIAKVIILARYDVIVLSEVRTEDACMRLVDDYLNNDVWRLKQSALINISGCGSWDYDIIECVTYVAQPESDVKKASPIKKGPAAKVEISPAKVDRAPRVNHVREYCVFVYRCDRVVLPIGCKLYEPKMLKSVSTNVAASAGAAPLRVSSQKWRRSPCYAYVRSLVPSESSAPQLDWLIVAFHSTWGNGESDIVDECRQLESVYIDMAKMMKSPKATALPSVISIASPSTTLPLNCAIALLGDFNMNYFDEEFRTQCLHHGWYRPLIKRPNFSSVSGTANLYDQIYMEGKIVDAIGDGGLLSSSSSSSSRGVVFFDCDPDRDYADARTVSDHRPTFADLPHNGAVSHVKVPPPRAKTTEIETEYESDTEDNDETETAAKAKTKTAVTSPLKRVSSTQPAKKEEGDKPPKSLLAATAAMSLTAGSPPAKPTSATSVKPNAESASKIARTPNKAEPTSGGT